MGDQSHEDAMREAWELFDELVPKPGYVDPGRPFIPVKRSPVVSAYARSGKVEITIPLDRFAEQREQELVALVSIEEATRLMADMQNAFWHSVRRRDELLREAMEACRKPLSIPLLPRQTQDPGDPVTHPQHDRPGQGLGRPARSQQSPGSSLEEDGS